MAQMRSKQITQTLQRATTKMVRPLVRILLRNGISFGLFAEIVKRAYVEVATEEFAIPGKAQTTSRVSTLTGLTRKEVQRIKGQPEGGEDISTSRYNRAARVISHWTSDVAFQDRQGEPAELSFDGDGSSFSALVKNASGDITPRTILDELIHVRAVDELQNGKLKLLTRAYIPDGDDAEKINILGNDVADLIATIDHNIRCEPAAAFFQRKVCYDNLPEEAISELKQLIASKAQAALESMNDDMARRDRDNCGLDNSADSSGTGRVRAGLGIYYFEERCEKGGKGGEH
ncbi:MAG: hypothetical protein GXP10_07765 [Gammaproteobacteria bacterium]|nr:hypothetical protein [Gammaproteobacteria bacterium]